MTIPLHDPVSAALVISRSMPSDHLDTLLQLLLATPLIVADDPPNDDPYDLEEWER